MLEVIPKLRASYAPPPPEMQSAPVNQPTPRRRRPATEGLLVVVERERVDLWRFVVGSFVVRIPVSTDDRMRIPEEMTLAIMKWRLAHLSPSNRWAPYQVRSQTGGGT